MIDQFVSRQFGAFLLAGGIAALVNFGSRFVYNDYLGFSASIILAYVTGMIVAFILARSFVFKGGKHSIRRSASLFVLVNLLAVFQTWGVSIVLADYLLPMFGVTAFVHEIAHGTGVLVPVFTSYLGHRHWSFRQDGEG